MKVSFISKWKKEEIKEYHLSTTKIKLLDETEVSKKISTKIVEIEVLEVTPDFFHLQWTEFEDKQSRFRDLFKRIFKLRLGETFTISYKTTPSGTIDELVDREDLDAQIQQAKAYIKSKENPKKKQEFLENTFNSELISAKLLRLIFIFHFPFEEEYALSEVSEPIHFSNRLMEGNDIPGELRTSLIYFDEASNIGEIQIEKKYHQNALNKVMKETINKIDQQLENNRKTAHFPLLVVTETFWYKVDFKSGWIINGKYEKAYMGKGQENIERIEINLI